MDTFPNLSQTEVSSHSRGDRKLIPILVLFALALLLFFLMHFFFSKKIVFPDTIPIDSLTQDYRGVWQGLSMT
ncbi:MAG: hypothetical protein ABI430_03160 [Candidatus Taylorbacteria bacterium]